MNTQHLSVVVDVQGKIESFKAAASEMQQYLDKLKLPALQEGQAANLFGRIAQEIEKIQGLTAKGNITPVDSKKIQEAEHNLANLFGQLELFSKSPAVSGAATKQMVAGWNEATQAVHEYVNALKEINKRKPTKSSTQMESRLGEYTSKVDSAKTTLLDRASTRMSNLEAKREKELSRAYDEAFKAYLAKNPNSWYKDKTSADWRQNASKAEQDKIENDLKNSSPDYAKTIQQLEQVKALIAEVNNGLMPSAENSSGLVKETEAYKKASEAAKQYQASIESARNSEANIGAEAAQGLEKLRQTLSKIKGVNWKEFLPDGKDLNTATFEEITQAVQKFQESLNQTGKNSPQLETFFKKISGAAGSLVGDLNNAGEALDRLSERQKNASQTLSYLQYAFSTISVFRLFRRAISSVHDAVKELDAAMMETAVVTKYTISDLWKKLPEYTERANRLGVSTLGAYQSATLYYQQGLGDKQVGAISEETLKMARIASLDYADATNYMTAALRGFNMELNNTSAERVNDVYNRLAAMTAADTAGIATAMTKTASIAKSAGIEFEQMAAFLAQIIETTQESPETAGTAMKTVIARFSEVKKLYSEGEILGSDEEGEEINVNKIQEALRKVGISMTGFFTGTQGLGDILIELASKWNTLDVATQRYIATTAAGSRQQSRFIALMQDYSRTQELVSAAYDSEGASQNQFEKTLDSLDAKTQQLKNAWNEFLLDLANSDTIKGVVDLLNGVVKAINSITGALGSGGSGIAKLLLGLGVFKAGRSLLGGMGYMMNPSTLKDYGGNRLMAFRAGAASSMGLRDYDAKTGKSVIGAAYSQNIHQPHQALRQGHVFGNLKNNIVLKNQLKQDRENFKIRTENYKKESEKFRAVQEKQEWKYQDDKGRWRWKEGAEEHGGSKKGTFATAPEKELEPAAKELGKSGEELTESQKQLQSSAEAASNSLMMTGQQMQALGQIAGVAAAGCMLLANHLESVGQTKAAKTVKIIGTALGVLAGVFMVVGTASQMAAAQIASGAATASTAIMAIPILGWIAAVITAIIALVAIISNYVETAEERVARLEEETENAKKAAEEASNAYDQLLQARQGYNDLLDQISNLTKGTNEYREAVEKLNAQVLALKDEYPELEYTYNVEGGYLEIDEESFNRAETAAKNRKMVTDSVAKITGGYSALARDELELDKSLYDKTRRTGFGNWLETAGSDVLRTLAKGGDFLYQLVGIKNSDHFAYDKENIDFIRAVYEYLPKEDKRYLDTYANSDQISNIVYKYLERGVFGSTEDAYNAAQELSQLATTLKEKFPAVVETPETVAAFRSATLAMSDQSESAFLLAKAYDKDFFMYGREAAVGQQETAGEWSKSDLKKASLVGGGTILQSILDYGLESGLLSGEQVNTFSQWNYDSGQTLRQMYAAFTGANYDDIKDKDDQELTNYLGSLYESLYLQHKLELDQEKFNNLDPALKAAFLAIENSPDEATQTQLDLLKEYGLDELIATFTNIGDDYWNNLREVLKNESWVQNGIVREPLYNRQAEKQWKNFKFYNLEDLYENLFKNVISETGLSEKQKKTVLEALNTADLTDLNSLWKTFDILKDAGIDLQSVAPQLYTSFVQLIGILENAGIAIKKFTKEEGTENIKSARGIQEELQNSDSKTLSAQSFETLKNLLKNTEFESDLDYFLENSDGSFTYFGDKLDIIIADLDMIAGRIPKDYSRRIEAQGEISNGLQYFLQTNVFDRGKTRGTNQENWNNYSQLLEDKYGNGTDKQGNDAELMAFRREMLGGVWNPNFDLENAYEEAVKNLDASAFPDGTDVNKAKQDLINLLTEHFRISNGLEQYAQVTMPTFSATSQPVTRDDLESLTNSERAGVFVETISLLMTAYGEKVTPEMLQEAGLIVPDLNNPEPLKGINPEQFTDEMWETFLKLIFENTEISQLVAEGMEKESLIGQNDAGDLALFANNENNEDTNRVIASNKLSDMLDQQDEQEGLALLNMWAALDDQYKTTDETLKALSHDAAKFNKVVKEQTKNISESLKVLEKEGSSLEDKNKAYQQIRKSLKQIYGKEFTNVEIDANMPLIKKLAKGGKEGDLAGRELGKSIVAGAEAEINEKGNSPEMAAAVENFRQQVYDNFDQTGVSVPLTMNFEFQGDAAAADALADYLSGLPDGIIYEAQATGDEGVFQIVGHYVGFDGGGFGGGGGGGGGAKSWENPYDKYHNLLQKIDELLRQRNDLERQYNKLIENRHTTIAQLLKNTRENVANLEKEIAAQERLQKGRREQLRNLANGDYYFDDKGKRRSFAEQAAKFGINLSDYVKYNEETQQIEINWDAFEEVERRSEKDEKWAEIGKFLEKYYDQIKELSGSYEETQDAIEEMQDAIDEIRGRSKEEYLDFEQKLYDAIVDHIQQYIDAEQELSDTISEAENKILENLRESIDLERQIRDNTKTEEDIADKENRLAYLQRDTTGANALEIQQLQKEIDEAREQYQDTLVDQELERLTRASEEAAEQREHQIELMQEQLDWAEKAGYFWEQVESMIQASFINQDTTQIEELLSGISEFNVPSAFGAVKWKDDLVAEFLKASEGRANWELDRAKENNTSQKTAITASGEEGNSKIWWDTEKGQWVDAKGNTYTGVGYDVSTHTWKYEGRSDRVQQELDQGEKPPSGGPQQPQTPQTPTSTKSYNTEVVNGKAKVKEVTGSGGKYSTSQAAQEAADRMNAWSWIQTGNTWAVISVGSGEGYVKSYAEDRVEDLIKKHILQYATGGLNTKTGLAWLDGTPTKPEYVLNADQTAAFLQLTDVLPSIMGCGLNSEPAPTSVMIDVDINVDSISSDYDVDRLADRLKEDIYNDMMYRNVNVVSLRR